MRRLTPKQRAFHIRKMRHLVLRKTKQRRKIREQVRRFDSWQHIQAPVIFSLQEEKHRTKFLAFAEQIRVSIIKNQHPICLDFSVIERLDSDATLLFVAELRRALKLIPGAKVRCIPPRKRRIAQVFHKIDIFKILRHRKCYECVGDPDVVHWRFAMGHNVEGEKYEDILGPYDGRIADKLANKLYVGITEAMKNAHNHAHFLRRQDGMNIENDVKSWWMFSQEKDGFLSVVFCDLGAGIPRTLPHIHPDIWQKLHRLTQGKSVEIKDADIILEATKLKVSRTGQSHRGRGLNQIVNAVTNEFHGNLVIYSNYGCYTVGRKKSTRNFNSSIMGTLIAWRIPLNHHEEKYHGTSNH